MARVAPAPAAAAPEEAPAKGSKKKLILIIAIVLIVLAAGGAAAAFMLASKNTEGEAAEKVAEPLGPPTFVIMDQFVVNLTDPDSTRYLQIGITYELDSALIAEEVKTFIPVIRSRILLVLSGKNVKNLTSIEGKQQLMDELVDLARVTINGDFNSPTRGIRDVHFSSFVIQ